jgi:hypothetical protein
MTKLNVIAMTKFLRSKGWAFRRALDTARTVRDLATSGMLPSADTLLVSTSGAESVTILQMELAGGVVRLATTTVTLAIEA